MTSFPFHIWCTYYNTNLSILPFCSVRISVMDPLLCNTSFEGNFEWEVLSTLHFILRRIVVIASVLTQPRWHIHGRNTIPTFLSQIWCILRYVFVLRSFYCQVFMYYIITLTHVCVYCRSTALYIQCTPASTHGRCCAQSWSPLGSLSVSFWGY